MPLSFDVNDACPKCGAPSVMPFTAEIEDVYDCGGCGVRLVVCADLDADPVRVWPRTEDDIRAEAEKAREAKHHGD